MKKLILLAAAIFFIFNANAQSGWNAGAQYGYYLVGMINGPSSVTIDQRLSPTEANPYTHFATKYSSKIGISAGYGFLPIFGVQAELNFAQLGQNSTGTFTGGETVNRTIDLNYTEIPIFLKLRAPGEVVHYYFMAGPQFNFLSSASITDSRGAHYSATDASTHFKSNETGLAFDTGIEVDITKFYFNLGLRGYYGFSDPNMTAYQLPSSNGDYKSSNNFAIGLNLAAHYKF